MKTLALIIILTVSSVFAHPQDTIFIYFNKDWKETTKDSAFNKRKAYSIVSNKWIVSEAYPTGNPKMIMEFKDKKMTEKNGKFVHYFENGNKQSEGEYSDNFKHGSWTNYYENGKIKSKENYTIGDKNGEWISYYENGNISEKSTYIYNKEDGNCIKYFENGNIMSTQIYSKGNPVFFAFYYESGKKCGEEKYSKEKDKLTQRKYWDEKGKEVKQDEVEIMPDYPGGTDALLRYIKVNIEYPKLARETGIQGTVLIQFVIDKDGNVTSPLVERGIGGDCDEEALRVVGNMPKWIPGKQCKHPVSVHFKLPIKFTLKN